MRIIKLEMRLGILRTVTQFDTSFLRGKSGSSERAVSSTGSRNRVVSCTPGRTQFSRDVMALQETGPIMIALQTDIS
jgi:hypothetical protein